MKRIISIISISLLLISFSSNDVKAQFRVMNNSAYKEGEKLTFVIYFDSFITGKIKAAYGTFEVLPALETIGGRKCYHIVASGATFKKWSWAIYVNDRFDTYIDKESQMPWLFLRRAHEGKFTANQDITFNHSKNIAQFKNNKKNTSVNYYIPTYAQDMVSAGYYARNMTLTNLTPGAVYSIPYVFEDSLYSTSLIYKGKETIKIGQGKFRCMAFKPQVLTGTVFGESYPLTIYVTDDKNKVPIFAKASILIGNVKFELLSYSGLKNPIESKVK